VTIFNYKLLLQKKDTEVYEKYDALLHGKSRQRHEKILSVEFMRKYIHIAKCMKRDRVQIVGSYRCLPGKRGGYTSGTFRTVLLANNISLLSKESNLDISREDIMLCKKLAKNNDIFELLSKSLAPSIHGHTYVKQAILCLLLGGVEKILPSGHFQGGHPCLAQCSMLRFGCRQSGVRKGEFTG